MEAGAPPLCFEKPTLPSAADDDFAPYRKKGLGEREPNARRAAGDERRVSRKNFMVPSASRSRPSARTAGAKVYISARKAAACEETAKRLSVFGECIAMPADASGAAGARTLAGLYLAKESKLNILVNNAGAHGALRSRPFPRTVGTK